tara:strand:- start:475 stop:870 length:396 start_codon:yes stop_codon:yes gene_type:complete
MSTRAQVRFATREEGVSFNEHPDVIHAQFYRHHDGYPEGLGVDIANSLINKRFCEGRAWEIEELTTKHGDLEYIYYIWQAPGKSTWISIFEVNYRWCDHCNREISKNDQCIFVGEPSNLINKYKPNTNEEG